MFAALLLALGATSHPGHATIAQMEFNPRSGRIEVALSVSADALEATLVDASGRRVGLEHAAQADPLIRVRLAKQFRFQPQPGEVAKIHWVGRESEGDRVWLYFELEAPRGFRGARLANTLFMDGEGMQINTVAMKTGKWRRTLTFTPKRKQLALRPAAAPEGLPAHERPSMKPAVAGQRGQTIKIIGIPAPSTKISKGSPMRQ